MIKKIYKTMVQIIGNFIVISMIVGFLTVLISYITGKFIIKTED